MDRLIPPLTLPQRMAFLDAVRAYTGVRFRHRGRSPSALDCLGLPRLGLRDIGIDTADERTYGRHPEPEGKRLRAVLTAHFGQPVSVLEPGCIVAMAWHEQPNHVGVIGDYPLGGLSLIHADATERRVIEHILAAPWPRRIVAGWLP